MAKARILVVEDEGIVAHDIKSTLEGMGYEVPAIAFTGNEAIEKAEETLPDLVLMDIVLKGDMDGIDAAEQIRSRFGIPSIYLTAHADEEILQRAKITESYGYILKPYVDRELRSNIEMALFRIETDRETRLMKEMLSRAKDGILIHDLNGNFIYVNDSALKERGYTREEFQRMNVHDFVTVRQYKVLEKWWHDLEINKSQTEEIELRHKDGSWFPAEVIITKVSSGGRDCVLSITRNSAERKRVEEGLQASEEKYRLLVDNANEAIVVAQDGMLKFANPKTTEITNYLSEELTSMPFAQIIHPEDREMVFERYQKRLKGEQLLEKYPFRILTKEGNTKWVEINAILITWQGRPATLNFLGDITERKKVEEELKLSEERYRAVFENTGTATIIIEEDTMISLVNCEMELLSGYSREEIEGKKKWTEFVVKEDLERMKKYHKLRRSSPEFAPRNYEFRLIDKQGNTKDIWMTIAMIPGTKRSVASLLDVSERKKAEERIGHLNLILRAIRNVNQLITKEKDQDKLLQGICDNLTETRGYHDAWIALLDEQGKLLRHAESGLGERFLPMVERLERGELAACWQRALRQSEVVVIEDPVATCTDCPLSGSYAGRGVLTLRVEYAGKVYGILSVSVLVELVNDIEELGLFREVASDIAFALHNIEMEEKQRKAEEDLKHRAYMLDSVTDAIVLRGKDGRTLYANRAAYANRGYSRDEFMKLSSEDFMLSDEAKILQQRFREMEDKEYNIYHYEVFSKDGTAIPLETYAQMVEIGREKYLLTVSRDITKRKKAEENLRANEQELEMLLEYLPGMVFYKDSNFRYRRVNLAFTQLHKITREEIIGKTIGEASLLYTELAESNDCELMESGKVLTRNVEFPDETGGSRWQKVTKVPIKDENGKISGILGVGIDISDIVKAEEELKLRAEMLDQAGDSIILHDFDGNFIYVNETTLKERGYTREEFMKMNVRDLVGTRLFDGLRKWWRGLKEKGYKVREFEVRCKDGTLIPIEATQTKIKYKGKEYILSVTRNVTDRKKAEEALKLRVEMLNQARDGFMVHDLSGKFIYVNNTVLKERGYTREEFLKMNVGDLVTAQHYSKMKKWWKDAEDKKYRTAEVEIRRKDGTWFPVEVNTVKANYEGKEYILSITRNITERKKAEAEMSRLDRNVLHFNSLEMSSADLIQVMPGYGV